MLQLQELGTNKKPLWLVEPSYSIGAASTCQISVAGQTCYAELQVQADEVRLLPRADGILLNGEKIAVVCTLKKGDRIEIGGRCFELIDPKFRLQTQQSSPTQSNEKFNWYLVDEFSKRNERIPLDGRMVLGRSPSCDLVLDSSKLSRRHAEIEVLNHLVNIKDLQSANGTFINGKRIDVGVLREGDLVCFDQLCYRLVKRTDAEFDIDKTNVRPRIELQSVGKPVSVKPTISSSVPRAALSQNGKRVDIKAPQVIKVSAETSRVITFGMLLILLLCLSAAVAVYFLIK